MSGPGQSLREIHRLRRLAKGLQDEIDRAPRQLKAQQARVARHEEIHREAQETMKKLKVVIHEKEVSTKTTHSAIAKHQKQLNEAGGKKEYDALQSEIAADKQAIQRLEEEILTAMAEVEEHTIKLPELEQAVRKAKEEFAAFQKGSGERHASLTVQLKKASSDLKEIEAALPGDIRPLYNRIIASRGEDGLSLVKDRNCSACYTGITAQNYNELMSGMFVVCKSCGRILYLAE
jgi:predicted  nucleic acid-binding Zn-ribbon protein